MSQPIASDLPYPNVDSLTTDIRSGNIISFAYAAPHGELTAVLQYIYHSYYFYDYGKKYADTLIGIAVAEMRHLDMIGRAMKNLGVDPIYRQTPQTPYVYYNASAVTYSKTPQKMLMDDIEGELNAIADYKKMLFLLKNEQVAALIQRIVMDEEMHVSELKNMLEIFTSAKATDR